MGFLEDTLGYCSFHNGKIHDISHLQREEIFSSSVSYRRILTLMQREKIHSSKGKIIKRNMSTNLLGFRVGKMWMFITRLKVSLEGIWEFRYFISWESDPTDGANQG